MKAVALLQVAGTLIMVAGVLLIGYQITNVGTASEAPDYFVPLGFAFNTLGLVVLFGRKPENRGREEEEVNLIDF